MANSFNLSPSFFTRIYLSILSAIILSFALTQYVVDDMMTKDAIDDFVRDTKHIYNKINHQIAEKKLLLPQSDIANQLLHEDFSVRWLSAASDEHLCQQCQFLANVDGVEVFEGANGLLAVYRIENIAMRLTIADKVHPNNFDDDIDQIEQLVGVSVEEAVFILFVVVLLLIISLTVYWPIRQLQKQINSLVNVTQDFGAGHLETRANEQLTKPLNKLAQSFNAMASAISDTVQENQIFAQAVPHEVRTPLSRIQLATGLLRKGSASELHLELLDNIDNYIDDIDELINQVVAFSKLNAASDDESDFYESIEFCAFVASRIEAFAPKSELNIVLDIEPGIEITTNPVYLRLLLDNLIKNAISHSKNLVKISVQKKQNNIVLIVEDDGPGIPEAFYETIFFPFARLDKSRSRKTGGLGLGLAIAKSATKRMCGAIAVKNNSNGGALFIVEFLC